MENIRAAAYCDGKPCITMQIFRQPGANIIDTVDRIRAGASRRLKASIPSGIDVTVTMDRTVTIRASVHEIERTLLISIGWSSWWCLSFLRNPRATLIPSVAVPVSLIGTFGVMYLWGYSIDNLSLMALTISTGFVVDDAIVVIENITRHVEAGMRPAGSGPARRPGNRLHGAFDDHFAGGRVHSDSADGRHRRPAVPRICRDAFGGHSGFACWFRSR